MSLHKIKRSLVPGEVPEVGSLLEGQLGVNIPDGLLWVGDVDGNPVPISSSGGGAEYLDDLLDVTIANPPKDNDSLTYDFDLGQWIPKQNLSAIGVIEFGYSIAIPGNPSPINGYLTRGNDDPTQNIVFFVNRLNLSDIDISPWLEFIKVGDDLKLSLKSDSNRFERYKISGTPTPDGDIWNIPVVYIESGGAPFENGDNLYLYLRNVSAAPITDHGVLFGLEDDDHPQYLNQIRGDARYSLLGHTHVEADIIDLDKYTQAEVDDLLATKAPIDHTHPWDQISDKPLTFPPSDHEHEWADIIDKPLTFPPSPHQHNEGDIINLDKYTKAEIDAMFANLPGGGGSGKTEATIEQADHGFQIMDAIRYSGVAWVKAQANDVNTTALGIVVGIPDADHFTYAITGRYQHTHGLLEDEWYYLSDITAGGIVAVPPEIEQPIVYTEDAENFSIYAYRPTYEDKEGALEPGGRTEAVIIQPNHGLKVMDCIRWDGTAWVKALADDIDTTALGVVVQVLDADIFRYAMSGRYDYTHGLEPDEWFYLSDTTPGALVGVAPAIEQPIVYAEDADTFIIFPYRPSVALEIPESGGATEATIDQLGHGFALMDAIRHNGTEWVHAQADDPDTTALGVVVEVLNQDVFKYAITGRYEALAHGLNPTEWYYLSDSVPGGIQSTSPDIQQPLIYIEDENTYTVYAYRPSQKVENPPGPIDSTLRSDGDTWVPTENFTISGTGEITVKPVEFDANQSGGITLVSRDGVNFKSQILLETDGSGAPKLAFYGPDNINGSSVKINTLGQWTMGVDPGVFEPPVGTALSISTDGVETGVQLGLNRISDDVPGPLIRATKARGSFSAPTPPLASDQMFNFQAIGWDGTSWTNSRISIRAYAQGNWSPTNQGTYLAFRACPENTTYETDIMTIEGNGLVKGIFMGEGVTQNQSKIEIVTAMPGTPDENTLYFITD